jgi:hypothetical protein
MWLLAARHVRRNLIAYIALFVALGSSSYAAAAQLVPRNSVGSPQVINGSLQTRDLSRRAVAALRGARGPRGLQGRQGIQGIRGTTGAQGIQGAQGPPGTARAYGRVGPIGQLSRSKNVVAVTEVATGPGGVYCIQLAPGIDASQTGLVATLDFSQDVTDTGPNAFASWVEWDADAPDCPAGQLEVYTFTRIVDTTLSPDGDVRTITNQLNNNSFFFIVP